MSRRRSLCTAGVLVAGAVLVARDPHLRRRTRDAAHFATRRARHLRGVMQGAEYRAAGHQPDPMVDDITLADRVRSELGRLERHLDVPHLHVTVRHHVATLHGEVISDSDVEAVERRVLQVSGVWGVRSYLHVGLASGDTPPSVGRTTGHASPLLEELLAGAAAWGVEGGAADRTVHAVLQTLAERIPDDERRHLASHLPFDVRHMLRPPARRGSARRVRDVDEFLAIVADTAHLDERTVAPVAESVLATLRRRVPEEAGDVAAVLPSGLRAWWRVAVPA